MARPRSLVMLSIHPPLTNRVRSSRCSASTAKRARFAGKQSCIAVESCAKTKRHPRHRRRSLPMDSICSSTFVTMAKSTPPRSIYLELNYASQDLRLYLKHQGYGSSPIVYHRIRCWSRPQQGGGAIVALDRQSGDEIWRHNRPKTPNYPSPIVLNVAGRDQLVMIGCDLVDQSRSRIREASLGISWCDNQMRDFDGRA